jgi:integrase/recombinase XerD
MLQYEFTNGTISLFFDDRRANKDGKYPLRWRLYYRGKRVYYPINKYLTKEEWDALPTSRIVSLVEIRKDLNYYFNEILINKINELVRNNNFSVEQFNYLLGKSDILSVNDAFNAKIKELEKDEKISNSIIY